MDKKVIHTVLDNIANELPNLIAIEDFWEEVTYRCLFERSNGIGNALLGYNIQIGDVIGVFMQSSAKYVSSILGVKKAGGIFMPLAPGYPNQRMIEVIKKAQPKAILIEAKELSLFELLIEETGYNFEPIKLYIYNGEKETISIWNPVKKEQQGNSNKLDVSPISNLVDGDSSNYIIYTSGSTGSPKIIEGAHKSLSHFIHWQVKEFELHTERIGQLAPISFDVSFRDIFTPLLSTGTLCIPKQGVKFDIKNILHWIGEKKLTILHLVPSVFRQLIREIENTPGAEKYVRSLKVIFLAGEALYYKDVQGWHNATRSSTELVNLYGPSETTLAKLYHRINADCTGMNANDIVPLGKPISNTMAAVISEGLLCENGEMGEVFIKTPFRSKGYYKDDELTKERFIQNPLHQNNEDILYKTGDLGKKLADGDIAFLGRVDNQIKIRGNRVELLEVQNTLERHSDIIQAVVVPYQHKDLDIKLIGYYRAHHKIEGESIKKYLEEYLPIYMIPSFLLHQKEFPLNFNGKIDKKALPKPEAFIYDMVTFKAPENEVQRTLASIWSEVLGIAKIGIQNTFFELGGHSLSATRAVSMIHQKIDTKISLKEFFEYPTIEKLSLIVTSKEQTILHSIPKTVEKPHYSLTPQQKSMWLASQLKGFESAYVMGGVYMLEKSIKPKLLEKAFLEIIGRYEILRTVFPKVNGVPVQKILSDYETMFALDYDDVKISAKKFEALVSSTFKAAFNLEQGPLFKMKLVRFKDDKYALLLHLHHLICDAWSNAIITKEVIMLYNGLDKAIEIKLPLPEIQYKDYAVWLNAHVGKNQKSKNYWLDKLKGSSKKVNLPIDYPYDNIVTNEASTLSFTLGEELSKTIRTYINSEEISLFMWVSSLLQILLYKYSGDKDVNFGTPVSGRNHSLLEEQIGLFLNYIVVSQQINPQLSLKEYLQEAKSTILEAYEHQNFPFYELVEALDSTKEISPYDLYNVLLVMNNEGLNGDENDLRELAEVFGLREYTFEHAFSKLDLTIFFNDQANISFNIEYKKELFKEQTILHLGKKMIQLTSYASSNPNQKITDILYEISEQEEKEYYLQGISELNTEF